jgi:hypothetical protein
MPLYGYARVSTLDQDLSIQRAALKAAGCDVIRAEKASGTRRDGRTELQVLLDFLRTGDTLVVTRIDRLARSLKDLQDIVYELKGKGVALKATEQPVDTSTAAGKAFLDMLAVSGNWRGSAPLRRAASTRAGNQQSTPAKSGGCVMTRNSARRRSPAGSALAAPVSIACSVKRPMTRTGSPMPIKPELRWFYPIDWPQISRQVRFERAGGRCQTCGRPHGETVRCLPDGRWYDTTASTWRNGRGRPARWPDLEEATHIRHTRVVLAAAHLDHNPSNNRPRNLRGLCQRCHLIHDRPHHLARRRITYLLRRALGDLFLGPYPV